MNISYHQTKNIIQLHQMFTLNLAVLNFLELFLFNKRRFFRHKLVCVTFELMLLNQFISQSCAEL